MLTKKVENKLIDLIGFLYIIDDGSVIGCKVVVAVVVVALDCDAGMKELTLTAAVVVVA